jgi:hypothetical protein
MVLKVLPKRELGHKPAFPSGSLGTRIQTISCQKVRENRMNQISLEEHAQWPSLPPFPQKKQVDDDLDNYLKSITFLLRTEGRYRHLCSNLANQSFGQNGCQGFLARIEVGCGI